jgi:hypothetical protein
VSKVTTFTTEEVVKETYIVYVMKPPRDITDPHEVTGKVKKSNPKKHARKLDGLKFPEWASGFYYYDVYVAKLKIGKKTIKFKSGKVNTSKEYKI